MSSVGHALPKAGASSAVGGGLQISAQPSILEMGRASRLEGVKPWLQAPLKHDEACKPRWLVTAGFLACVKVWVIGYKRHAGWINRTIDRA